MTLDWSGYGDSDPAVLFPFILTSKATLPLSSSDRTNRVGIRLGVMRHPVDASEPRSLCPSRSSLTHRPLVFSVPGGRTESIAGCFDCKVRSPVRSRTVSGDASGDAGPWSSLVASGAAR